MSHLLHRRDFLRAFGQTVLGASALGIAGLSCKQASACATPPPPVCRATAANIEGPFFKANAPKRSVLVEPKDPGERFVLTGRVLSGGCIPVASALVEIWHADASGAYDNVGDHFRGVLETDARGEYKLQTILPGRYLNGRKFRPAHIHAKVHIPGRPSLTTQLYFEGDPENRGDPFIVDSLIMAHRFEGRVRTAHFDFVV